MAPATDDAIAALDALREEVECCSGCVLGSTRTKAVFGEGDPGADLMFVGEAPGYHEDQQGRPFVGQAGKLLEQLLASIGLTREQVYIANVLKSRPPNNRDPRPEEIDACRPYLFRQIEIIKPRVICTLGNFATKLLTGDPTGITKVHGRPKATEIAGHALHLYPIFHPAAALYTPAMLTTLKEDFSRLPQLLAQAAPKPGDEAAEPPAAERPAWQPPDHLRRDVAPAAAAAAASPEVKEPAPEPVEPAPEVTQPAPEVTEPAPEPTLEDLARISLDATPIDDHPASGEGAPDLAPARPGAEPATETPRSAPADAPPTPPAGDADDTAKPPAGPPGTPPAPAPQPPRASAVPPAEPEQLGLF